MDIQQPENDFVRHRMEMARNKAQNDLAKACMKMQELDQSLKANIFSLPEHVAIAALAAAVKGPERFPHITVASHIVTQENVFRK